VGLAHGDGNPADIPDGAMADLDGGTVADPLYRRIAEELREQIESGRLRRSDQLPTEEELSKQFQASRNTIREAVKSLISLGLVETRPGQGTFVTEPADPLVTTLTADRATGLGGGEGVAYLSEVKWRNPRSTVPRVELQTAAGEIAARLGVEVGTPVVSRHEQRFINRKKRPASDPGSDGKGKAQGEPDPMGDEAPWSLQTSFYPRSFAMRGAERLLDNADIAEGTVKYLEEMLGIKQIGYRDWITLRAPDANEIAFFRLPPDGRVPVFEIFRTAFDQNGAPMRVTVTIFPADRNQFIIDVGQVPAPQYEPPSK
jgi:GntR family transcriptional regulator